MKKYNYIHPKEIEYTDKIPVFDENDNQVLQFRRVYNSSFKKWFDRLFDYRYFLNYQVESMEDEPLFMVKKISRRGKLWFEGTDVHTEKKFIISYDNWRLGIPILYVTDGKIKIQLDKTEEWSQFKIGEEIIAQWKAEYIDSTFQMTLMIDSNSPIQQPQFFIAICQAALFVGA